MNHQHPPSWKKDKIDLSEMSAEIKLNKERSTKKVIFLDIVEIIDDIDRIFDNDPNLRTDESKYLQIVRDKLDKVLGNNGVTEMQFDSNTEKYGWCQVLGTEKKDGCEEEAISKVIKKGYLVDNKVLRMAGVIIVKNKEI